MLLLTSLAQALPAPLHRLGLRGAHAVRRLIWKVRRPVVEGVRVLADYTKGLRDQTYLSL